VLVWWEGVGAGGGSGGGAGVGIGGLGSGGGVYGDRPGLDRKVTTGGCVGVWTTGVTGVLLAEFYRCIAPEYIGALNMSIVCGELCSRHI
jgi:hypothetical protein